ncbi:hypothetical protein MTR67_042218 [Solanum verrucosum]|uniref:Uncharacterized protein n=1 Tax=Solanum verrucosum TaxID=315347 RepID=A0AAF0ULJ4_SOLVR|nr:hypothetical protein MTR67_042218 [Solanum verrucosum]
MKILKPNSELADFIEAECSKDSWQGIVTRLWPNTKYMDVVVTGAMSQYIPTLDYYSNNLPLVSGYFEFLTIHRGNEIMESISTPTPLNEKNKQQLVNLVDVEIDQEYELVVTTYSVKNATNDLMPFDAHIIDYTSYADTATIPGYYILFWELSVNASAPIPPSVLEDCCLTIEESLSSVYRQGRTSDKSIGPLEIRLVETGANVIDIVQVLKRNMAEENKKNLEFIEEVTTNVDEVQKRVLHEILTRNANVEYLQRLNLNGHTDRETFKKFVPVITYEDIQPDINRIANGDTSPILCSQPVSEFISSTGTLGGEKKLIPTTEEEHGRRLQLYGLVKSVVSQFFPDLEKGKGMYFFFIKSEVKTPEDY